MAIKYHKGFTMFFAVLVSSLALTVGLAIYDLLIREATLTEVATQSQVAIDAADTGAECALYWENKCATAGVCTAPGVVSAFPTSTDSRAYSLVPVSGVTCNGLDMATTSVANTTWPQSADSSSAVTVFTLILPSGYATVKVSKTGNPSITTVRSDGYNSGDPGSLQIQRTLQVTY